MSFGSTVAETAAVSARDVAYAVWRREGDRAARAYRAWGTAPRRERRKAHAAYLEALEREESAARAYQQLVESVQAP